MSVDCTRPRQITRPPAASISVMPVRHTSDPLRAPVTLLLQSLQDTASALSIGGD